MRVRLHGPVCGPGRYHDAGDVVDLPDDDARVLLRNRDVAACPGETAEAKGAPGTAVGPAPETTEAPARDEAR